VKNRSRHPLRENIEVIVFAIIMALGLKVFAVEAYQIPTASMMPTLMGTDLLDPARKIPNGGIHDRVLVDKLIYLLRDPVRWEVVVFRYPLVTPNNYVKRLVGMPGEELWIREGDLYARKSEDEEFQILRKPTGLQETLWKRVFPQANQEDSLWSAWALGGGSRIASDGGVVLADQGSVIYNSRIYDDYLHGYPEALFGRIPAAGAGLMTRHLVGDLKLEFEARPDDTAGPLKARLDCGPWSLLLTLPGPGSSGFLELPGGRKIALDFPVEAGQPVSVSLAWWDHRARLVLDGGGHHQELTQDVDLEPGPITSNGVRFSCSKGSWRLAPPRIFRDIHYLPSLHGGQTLFKIPEGEYFMMGDNTHNSLDSRDWQAREIDVAPPIAGRSHFRGDSMRNGPDPFFDNPRWNRTRTVMTFRDEFGEVYAIPRETITKDAQDSVSTVPRAYLLGKALATFLPVPPFSPVARIGLVH